MKNRTLAAVGVFVVTLLLSPSADPALAQGKGPDKVKPAKQSKPVKDDKPGPVFRVRDRDVITVYYTKHPGARHNGRLPPGLEKQLERNGTLPPGLRARFRPFPLALERDLGPLPYGYRRGFVDDYVVVYKKGTYVIADSYLYQVR